MFLSPFKHLLLIYLKFSLPSFNSVYFISFSSKKLENETEWEAARRQESRCIWLTGRKGATEREAALAIIQEAKSLIQQELGGLGIQWKTPKSRDSLEEGSNPDQSGKDCSRDLDKSLNNHQIGLMKMKPKGSVRKRRSLSRKSSGLSQARSSRGKGFGKQEKSVVISPPSTNSQRCRNKSNIGTESDSGKPCDNDCIVVVADSSEDSTEGQENKKKPSITGSVVRQSEEQSCQQGNTNNPEQSCQQGNTNNPEERDCEKNCTSEVRGQPNHIYQLDQQKKDLVKAKTNCNEEEGNQQTRQHEATEKSRMEAIKAKPSECTDRGNVSSMSSASSSVSKLLSGPAEEPHVFKSPISSSMSTGIKKSGPKTRSSSSPLSTLPRSSTTFGSSTIPTMNSSYLAKNKNNMIKIPSDKRNQSIQGGILSGVQKKITNSTDIKAVNGEFNEHASDARTIKEIRQTANLTQEANFELLDRGDSEEKKTLQETKVNKTIEPMVCSEDFADSFVIESQMDGNMEAFPGLCNEDSQSLQSKKTLGDSEKISGEIFVDKKIEKENDSDGILQANDSVSSKKHFVKNAHSEVENQKTNSIAYTADVATVNEEQVDDEHSTNGNDMNLSCSLLSSHDVSCDLLPASNFERCMVSDDESDVCRNESYRDLRIPYLSGQEACFDGNERKADPTLGGYQISQGLLQELDETFSEDCSEGSKGQSQRSADQGGSFKNGKKQNNESIDGMKASKAEQGRTTGQHSKTWEKKNGHMNERKMEEAEIEVIEEMDDSLTLSMVYEVLENCDKGHCNKNSKANESNTNQLKSRRSSQRNAKSNSKKTSEINCEELTSKKSSECNKRSTLKLKEFSFTKVKCSRSSQDKDKRLSPGTLAFLDDLHTSIDIDSDTIVMKTPLCQRRRGNDNKEGSTRDSVVMDEDLQNVYTGEDNVKTNECLSPTPPRPSLVNSPKTIRKATPNRHRSQRKDDRRSARKNIESLGVSMKNFRVPVVECAKSAEEEVKEWNSRKLESPTGEDPPYVERGPVVDPNETGIPPSQGAFTIIDVCADKELFDTFIKEWSCQPSFAISLACINKPKDPVTTTGGIGAKFTKAGDTGHKSCKGMSTILVHKPMSL